MGLREEMLKRKILTRFFGQNYYFDPTLANYGNEDELQERLRRKGEKRLIATDAFVFHYKNISQQIYTPPALADVADKKMMVTGEVWVPGASPKRIEDDHIARYKFAAKFVQGKRVLDIACGLGAGSMMLAQAGAAKVDGVDISEIYIMYARNHYKADNIEFTVADICSFKSNIIYDVIVCYETIEHVKDDEAALLNLGTLLRKNGLLIISTPNRIITAPSAKSIKDKPENEFHVREYTANEFTSLLFKSGFTLSKNNIYGQRQRIYFKSRYLREKFNKIYNPDENFSSEVKKVNILLSPRYYVFVAKK
ncbi:MAG: methyltransferase domain-containing protein [Candidatus Omnitrophica bacterium]|nr:methyltransferase domain-containing protein [Candidatus Omnitrophota bacterium]